MGVGLRCARPLAYYTGALLLRAMDKRELPSQADSWALKPVGRPCDWLPSTYISPTNSLLIRRLVETHAAPILVPPAGNCHPPGGCGYTQ